MWPPSAPSSGAGDAAGWSTTSPSTWSAGPSRPTAPRQAIPFPQLERLWRRDDVGVREKALWRLLYETAARTSEALSINVEDLELDNKRVRVRSKGGDLDWLHLQTGSPDCSHG